MTLHLTVALRWRHPRRWQALHDVTLRFGGLATLLINPLFLAPTFSAWLRNLARVAEAEGNHRPAPGSP